MSNGDENFYWKRLRSGHYALYEIGRDIALAQVIHNEVDKRWHIYDKDARRIGDFRYWARALREPLYEAGIAMCAVEGAVRCDDATWRANKLNWKKANDGD